MRLPERPPATKLTDAQVVEIRAKRERGATLKSLAIEYGVSITPIWLITTRKGWRHVP